MFEQIFGSVRSQIDERLSNPLAGSFLISWCIWNYKFFAILFSAENITKTFDLIDKIAFPDTQSLFLNGLLYPAITSAAYIFIYPYPAKFVYAFSRNRQREITEIKRRIEEETPLTIEESRRIRSELAQIESEHSEQIDKKDREIERLKSQLSNPSLETITTDIKHSPQAAKHLEESQINILRLVEKYDGKAPERRILSDSSDSQTKTEFDLGELVNKELLERNYRASAEDHVYTFTHAGRKFLLSHSGTTTEKS